MLLPRPGSAMHDNLISGISTITSVHSTIADNWSISIETLISVATVPKFWPKISILPPCVGGDVALCTSVPEGAAK